MITFFDVPQVQSQSQHLTQDDIEAFHNESFGTRMISEKEKYLSNFDQRFIDSKGFITPQPVDEVKKPADNAVLFLSVAMILGYKFYGYDQKIRSCYLENGLIARWPSNNLDQAAWDDYMGVASASIHLDEREIPREILWYGIKHMFVFDTDGHFEWRDFFGRHVHLWFLMTVAAFPQLKHVMAPLLKFVTIFFAAPENNPDTSAVQLQWLYLHGLYRLGIKTEMYARHLICLPEAFGVYYHSEHPFQKKVLDLYEQEKEKAVRRYANQLLVRTLKER